MKTRANPTATVGCLRRCATQNCTWNSRLISISSRSSGDLGNGSIRHGQKDLEPVTWRQHEWILAHLALCLQPLAKVNLIAF